MTVKVLLTEPSISNCMMGKEDEKVNGAKVYRESLRRGGTGKKNAQTPMLHRATKAS